MMVDTHCHLHMPYYDEDRKEVIERMEESNFVFALTVGVDIEDSSKAVELARRHPFIWASVGIHPHDASKMDEKSIQKLKNMALDRKVLSIGECGLDFYRNLSPQKKQYEAFEVQLELAKQLNMPVVIHTRNAHKETISLLERYRGSITGVIHCFSGGRLEAKKYLDIGFYISFAGHTTYPKNEELREVARYVPEDRMLVETDAPFLTPVPLRGKKNEPVFVRYTAETIAKVRGVSCEDLIGKVLENIKALWAIDF